MGKNNKQATTEDFIEKAIAVHGNRYDYLLVEYINNYTNVKIICKIHGIFEQSPNNHLHNRNCPLCSSTYTKSKEVFIKEAKLIHSDSYDYSLVVYKQSKIKIKIVCKIHGIFEQQPNAHLNNQGCPKCAGSGFDITKPAYLYYIKLYNMKILYKIGITNRLPKIRIWDMSISKDWIPTILQETHYENGIDAYNEEQRLHKLYKEFQYLGESIMKNGNTELFTKDVLGLDVAVE